MATPHEVPHLIVALTRVTSTRTLVSPANPRAKHGKTIYLVKAKKKSVERPEFPKIEQSGFMFAFQRVFYGFLNGLLMEEMKH